MPGFYNEIINYIQIILVIVILIVLYYCWGYGISRITKFRCHWSLQPVVGFFVDLFIYSLIEIPFCIFDWSYSICTYVHLFLMLLLSGYIIYSNRNNLSRLAFFNTPSFDWKEYLVLFITLLLGIFLVITNKHYYTYWDNVWDINNYTTALYTDHIYRYEPDSGWYVGLNNPELLIYSYLMYLGSLCKIFYVNPNIMFYRIIASIEVIFYIVISYNVIRLIFRRDKKKVNQSLLIFVIVNCVFCDGICNSLVNTLLFGGVTLSVITSSVIPFAFYFTIRLLYEEDIDNIWPIFILLSICSCFISKTGCILFLAFMGISFIPIMLKKHNLKIALFYIICCVPSVICVAFIYTLRIA